MFKNYNFMIKKNPDYEILQFYKSHDYVTKSWDFFVQKLRFYKIYNFDKTNLWFDVKPWFLLNCDFMAKLQFCAILQQNFIDKFFFQQKSSTLI